MAKISKFVKPLEGFQYSVNIQYDIYDDKKIESYIPSNSSLQIIEDILESALNNASSDRARILIGPYGKGKSHLVLLILSILSGKDIRLFNSVIKKAEEVQPNLAQNIKEYLNSGKKLLPVVVNDNGDELKTTLLQSLSIALKQAGLIGLMPTTFFDVAIEKILSWKNSYKDTYQALENKIGSDGDSFLARLRNYDQSSYDLFVKIYPTLTSGSEFNPLGSGDVIKVYDSVIEALKQYGYNGVFLVYDEFGKYLENFAEKPSPMGLKLVQSLAERSTRSGENQFHIMLVSHKSIDNYIGNLPKRNVDSWKSISQRFKAISINNEEAEIFDIITSVLSKEEVLYERYVNAHKNQFDNLQKLIDKEHSFESAAKILGNGLALSCYPLNPYSMLILPMISELVAQNERTIFTFLASSERFTVPYFIKTTDAEFPLVDPDYIYDYFEKLFKGEPYGSDIKKQWQITTAALAKVREKDNELAEKIIKTISLIYCVNQFEIIPPSWDLICEIYSINYTAAEINAAKEVLKDCHVLIELLYKPYVRLTQGSGLDVLSMIGQEKYAIENNTREEKILLEISNTRYLYPVQYNDINEITRYFDFEFLSVHDLGQLDKEGFAIESNADGIVYAILAESDADIQAAKEILVDNHLRRAIFILPRSAYDLKKLAIEYQAIKNLIKKYQDKDVAVIDELNYILEDRDALISSIIDSTYLHFDSKQSEIYHRGEVINIQRKSQMTMLMSDIMEEIYYRTPIVINDLINKNVISGPIKNARAKVLTALLNPPYKKDLGLSGSGPEINILRSTLYVPGIMEQIENPTILLHCREERTAELLQTIRGFVLNANGRGGASFGDLYNILKLPGNGFGLKNGIIPIYLAVVLSQFKEHLTIRRRDKEIQLNATLLADIDASPADYNIIVEDWNDSKENYLDNLLQIFASYISHAENAGNRFEAIAMAMRRWYHQLTKFESTTRYYCNDNGEHVALDREIVAFRNSLSNPDINAHEYLFERLPQIFGVNNYVSLVIAIRNAYETISNNYHNNHDWLIGQVKDIFNGSRDVRLSSILGNYYDDLKPRTKEHSFSGKIGLLIEIMKNPNKDEYKLIESIGRALFTLRMDDFTDEIMSEYINELSAVKESIDQYDTQEHENATGDGSYKIVYTDADGIEKTKQFDSVESTDLGEVLLNNITADMEEYGDAISPDEKRQILFYILKKLV